MCAGVGGSRGRLKTGREVVITPAGLWGEWDLTPRGREVGRGGHIFLKLM